LGRTGAAKCLHLLAPRFSPLWDAAIAKAYKQGKGDGADQYCRFMEKTKDQVKILGGEKEIKRNPLKALDEYNFMTYTRDRRAKERPRKMRFAESPGALQVISKRYYP
jgi:hypothetical protein